LAEALYNVSDHVAEEELWEVTVREETVGAGAKKLFDGADRPFDFAHVSIGSNDVEVDRR
jgi:hypothetical protein